jgi:hypothetical protein
VTTDYWNRPSRLLDVTAKLLLRKRAIVESIVDELKTVYQIEHSRHRSPVNFLVHLMAGLVAYCQSAQEALTGSRLADSAGRLAYPELTLG